METLQRKDVLGQFADDPRVKAASDDHRLRVAFERSLAEGKAGIESALNAASPTERAANSRKWRAKFQEFEEQEPLAVEAVRNAQQNLSNIIGSVSLEYCAAALPDFLEQIKRILGSLKQLSDANGELERLRFELEQAGVKTSAIPCCIFAGLDRWSDPHGGRVVGYQLEIRRNFPELAKSTI